MATMTERLVLNEGMSEGLSLQVKKVIRARRERVFEAWTRPEILERWFGPKDFRVTEITSDLRVGGEYRIEMRGPARLAERGAGDGAQADGERVAIASGVYREIVPNERLSFTWHGCWDPSESTLVTVLFNDPPSGGFGTEVTIRHERFVSVASMGGHEHGWTESLAKLGGLFEA